MLLLLLHKLMGLMLIALVKGEIPDSVSISIVGHTGPMDEGQQYELQCALQNVAPVGNVIVKWYKGDTLVGNTTFNDSSETPKNKSATLQISPSRDDDGAQYRCEAELNLGPEGPQPPPAVMSDPLTITVNYCPITLHPAKLVVEHGASASANCFTSITHKGIGWEASQGPVDMMENVQSITWSVKSIEEWDIAPFCFINREDDSQCQVHLPVTVYKIPKSVSISIVGDTGRMDEGKQYELQCDIQNVAPVGNVIVKWYKGDTLVGNTTFTESSKNPENLLATLQISPIRDDNGAQYRCEAELDLAPEGPQPPPAVMSDPLNITVHYKPVSACSNWSTVINTNLGSYPFPFVGNPSPSLNWYYRGSKVDPTKHLGKHDSGEYLYIAKNYLDLVSCSLTITVEYGPEIAPGDDSAEVNRGLNVNLTCKADGNPKPVLRWSFNNQPMATGKGEATLTISRAKVTDSGEYLCTAANKIGTQTKRVSLVVNDKCPITLHPAEVLVEYGASVTANCSTSITHEGMGWEASQEQVNETNDVQFITWSVDSLEKWDISPSCYINLIDDNQCTANLSVTIYKIPDSVSISIVGETGPVVEGREYELQCDIQNVAPVEFLTVKWYKGDILVKNTTFTDSRTTPKNEVATLQISPSRVDNGAQYRCEAELDLGPEGPQPPPAVMSDPLNITVHYKPEITCSDWSPISNTPLSSYPFPVVGNPTPELSWLQRGSLVKSTKRLSKDDSGQHQYNATNSVGSATCVTNITVKYAPEFVSGEDSVEVDRGMNTFLFCKAEGEPVPEVSWSFENRTLATGRGQTTLNISGARLAYGGEYTCTATNTFGSQTRRVSLVVHYRCPITLHPAKLVVEHGTSALANCSTSVSHRGIGWEASQGQVDMTENVQFITWSVKSIEEWDIAPFCYITQEDDQCQVHLPVTVYKIPDSVSIITVGDTEPMIEGQQYGLQCDIQNVAPVGNVIVKWYKGDTLVGNTTFNDSSKNPENLVATLQISPSRNDNGAQYRCKAELNLGPEGPQPPPAKTSDPLNITVHYKPVSACSDWSPVINTTLGSYPFPFVGNPPPQLTWYYRGSKVDPTKPLGKHDSGEYLYSAINTVDIASCSLTITVEYAPTFDCLKNYEGREHSLFSHNCTALASPVATVSWMKDGVNVQPPRNLTRRDNGLYTIRAQNKYGTVDHHLFLNVQYKPVSTCLNWSPVINTTLNSYPFPFVGNPPPRLTWNYKGSKVDPTKPLGKHDSGEYLYRAINTLDNVNCSLTITVEYAPTFDCLQNYEGREHSLFSHNCTALASPVATVSWIKEGVNVQPPRNLTRRDNGLYTIRAKNKYGTVDHPLYLNVLYAPVITLKEESVAVHKGSAVSMLCKAEGNPEPEVIWRFNNQIKLTGKRETILNISGVTAADGGEYTCTAKNKLGSQERRIMVAVTDYTIQIVSIIIILLLIIIISICIYLWIRKRRMRNYDVSAANGVNLSLLGNGKSK